MAVDDRPSLLILRSHIGYPSPDLTDDHEAHGNPFTRRARSPATKAVLGIPDEPFWAPAGARRRRTASTPPTGAPQVHGAWQRRASTPSTATAAAWDAAWAARRLDGLGRRPADVRAGREGRHPRGDREGVRRRARRPARAWSPAPPTSPATPAPSSTGQAPQSAETPAAARSTTASASTRMGAAMIGMARHGGVLPVGGTFFVFRDYMRPPVRLAVAQPGQGRLRVHPRLGRRRRGRPDAPAGRAARRAAGHPPAAGDPPGRRQRDRRRAGAPPSTTTGPTALVLSRQNIAVCTDGSAVERGAGVVRRRRPTRTSCSSAPAARSPCASTPPRGSPTQGVGTAGRQPAVVGPLRRRRPTSTATQVLPPGVPVLSVEAATTFGWARWADDSIGIDRFGASAPGARGARQARHQRRPRRRARHALAHRTPEGADPWTDSTTCTTSSARARGSTTSSAATSPPASSPRCVDRGIRGLTSNPTIFQKAIQGSADYDEQFRELAADDSPIIDDYWALVLQDINGALRRVRPGVRRQRRRRRLRQRRGRARPGPRQRRHRGGRPRPARAHRPPEPDGQDPGDRRGRRRRSGDDQRGPQHQRHADLQPRPLRAR